MDGLKIPPIGGGQSKLSPISSAKLSKPAAGGIKPPQSNSIPKFNAVAKPSTAKPAAVATIQSLESAISDTVLNPSDADFARADDEPTDVVATDDIFAKVAEMDGWDSIPGTNPVPTEIGGLSSSKLPGAPQDGADVAQEVLAGESTISSPVDEYEKQSDHAAPAGFTPQKPSVGINSLLPPSSQTPSQTSMSQAAAAASKPVEAPKHVEAPKPAPAAAAAPAEEVEMSDEEQLKALLDSMSPAERAEYEAHCAEQQREEIERQRAKQREMMEMYGNTSARSAQNKAPVGLIIVGLIICIGFVGLIVFLVSGSSEDEKKAAEEAVTQEVPPEPKPVRADPLNTYSVQINRGAADVVYINGVPLNGDTAKFVTGHRNTVMAFASGMVPYFKTFEGQVSETVNIEMKPDTLYAKGQISFRLVNPGITDGGLRVSFDGRTVGSFPGTISDVVLGLPHVLIIEKTGYAKHMHIIWANDSSNTVTVPDLKKEREALGGTECSTKKFPVSDKAYGIRIDTGGQTYNTPTVATVPGGDIIEYYVTREQRKPLQVSVIPDGYGTLQLDTVLLHDSIGETVIAFETAKGSDFQVCMRRVGEVICPNMKGETTVPSGNDWEMFAYKGTDTNPQMMRGSQMQTLMMGRKYTIEVGQDDKGVFRLNLKGWTKLKSDKDKK